MPYFTNRAITPLPVVVTGATWNSADKDASVSLSGGDLTITSSGTGSIRGTASASSGKKYWEIRLDTYTSGSNFVGGFANAAFSLITYPGGDNHSTGVITGNLGGADGSIYQNGSPVGTAEAGTTTGSTLCYALDIGNLKFWMRLDGGHGGGVIWNNDVIGNQNPATNTGGYDFSALMTDMGSPYFPACFMRSGDFTTAHFTTASWTQTPPSGFSEW